MVRSIVILAAIAATLCGCNSTPQPTAGPVTQTAKSTPSSGSNTDPGILPIGGGAMTPVTNPGAVDGAGSNVGQAAKNAAKSAAEKLSQPGAGTSTDASTGDQ